VNCPNRAFFPSAASSLTARAIDSTSGASETPGYRSGQSVVESGLEEHKVRKDPDLTLLRNCDDFKKLVQELEKTAKASQKMTEPILVFGWHFRMGVISDSHPILKLDISSMRLDDSKGEISISADCLIINITPLT
jgi:hypothetical protein